jgi:hypothetical protein
MDNIQFICGFPKLYYDLEKGYRKSFIKTAATLQTAFSQSGLLKNMESQSFRDFFFFLTAQKTPTLIYCTQSWEPLKIFSTKAAYMQTYCRPIHTGEKTELKSCWNVPLTSAFCRRFRCSFLKQFNKFDEV